jgi:hypothetical protein
MGDERRVDLLPGLSCFVWTCLLGSSILLSVAFVVAIFVFLLLVHAHPVESPAYHALVWGWLAMTALSLPVGVVGKMTKERRELMAGYTTLRGLYPNVDFVDRRSGLVLREAGSSLTSSSGRPGGRAPGDETSE